MMILDTNVVSEPIRPRGDPAVLAWLDRQIAETLFVTATSLAELLVGVEALPLGRCREGLDAALARLISALFGPRILSFDESAAKVYALLIGHSRGAGRNIAVADGQIAAIASVHGFTVATRDEIPFRSAGVTVINPWTAPGA